MAKKFFLAVFMLVLTAGSALAAHPLITDDTGTQGRGKFQLEINGEYAHDDENGTKADAIEVAAVLSYGASDHIDVILGVPFQWIRVKENGDSPKESGLSDMSLEVKWRFFEREKFSLALKPGLSLPAGDDEKGLGSGKLNFSTFLIATWDTELFLVHMNLGYLHNKNDVNERENLWHASVATEYSVTEKLRLVSNIGIEQNNDRHVNTNPAFILGGLIYSISEQVDIDFGIKAGLNKPETDYSFLAGIAWRF